MSPASVPELLASIDKKLDRLTERVTQLELARIAADARAAARAELASERAQEAAKATAAAITEHDKSRAWWLGVVGAAVAATSVLSPLVSHVVGQF